MKLPILLSPKPNESLFEWILRSSAVNLIPERVFYKELLSRQMPSTSIPPYAFYNLRNLIPDLEKLPGGLSNFFVQTTLLTLLPLKYTNSEITFHIHQLFNTYPLCCPPVKISGSLKEHCYCPQCEKEKDGYGSLPHQIPGVTVCWKHGCSLIYTVSKPYCWPINIQPEKVDWEFAVFCKKLLDSHVFTTLNHVNRTIYDQLLNHCPELNIHTFNADDLLNLCCSISSNGVSNSLRRTIENFGTKKRNSIEVQLALLFFLFEKDAAIAIQALRQPLPLLSDLAITAQVQSNNNGWLMKVTCPDCSHSYYTTAFAFEIGLKCPGCGPQFSVQQFSSYWISKASAGKYEVVSSFSDWASPLTVKNLEDGKEKTYRNARQILRIFPARESRSTGFPCSVDLYNCAFL